MKVSINFDMDGTIADLYSVDNWLPLLRQHNATPYIKAKPMLNLNVLARRLNQLQKLGYEINIISWLSKDPNEEYAEKVTKAKMQWLHTHLRSVEFDNINIIPHGNSKNQFCIRSTDILFDDEIQNRNEWKGKSFDEKNILKVLAELVKGA